MSNYHIKHIEEYYQVYRKSVRNPENFWEEIAEEHFIWRKKWNKVLSWDFSKPAVKWLDRKSTRLNSSHGYITYAVFCLKKKISKTQCVLTI